MSADISTLPIDAVIYVIDDDQSAREMVRAFLEPQGYVIRLFSSAIDFLSSFGIDPTTPSCIVSDVCMPVVDGMELQQRLIARGKHVPLILMSAVAGVPMQLMR